jgi:type II secretory pathway component PulK
MSIARVTPQVQVPRARSRAGFVTLLVLLVISVAAVVLASLNQSAMDDAIAGRLALAKARAQWAARAGVESMIAVMEFYRENPVADDAFRELDEMAAEAQGTLAGGTRGAIFRVSTWADGRDAPGPADAHARLNIALAQRAELSELPLVTEDAIDGILDWIDEDDNVTLLGAETDNYLSLAHPYEARNGPMRSIQELELVTGVTAALVRGEDWNLNGVLDANENDGSESWPPDNADGQLEQSWSGVLCATSVESSLGVSGEERLTLRGASVGDVSGRIRCDQEQAKAITDYVGGSEEARLGDFLRSDLAQLMQAIERQERPQALTNEQLGLLMSECEIERPTEPQPGRININTAPVEVLEYVLGKTTGLADAVLGDRAGRAQGYESIVELLEVEGMTRRRLAELEPLLTVRSSVYEVTSRGRDVASGIEVELRAVVDRSTLPSTIRDLIVR